MCLILKLYLFWDRGSILDFRLSFLPIFLQRDYKSRAIFLVEELGQFGDQYHHPELLGHVKEKILSASLEFGPNSFLLPRPQNRLFILLELLKLFARPPLSGFRVTWQRFSLFLLYLFWQNLWKIILNYKKL